MKPLGRRSPTTEALRAVTPITKPIGIDGEMMTCPLLTSEEERNYENRVSTADASSRYDDRLDRSSIPTAFVQRGVTLNSRLTRKVPCENCGKDVAMGRAQLIRGLKSPSGRPRYAFRHPMGDELGANDPGSLACGSKGPEGRAQR